MAEHNVFNLAAPPEFQGLREDLPLTVYQRHLPHWRQPGATYFVTFRLADSLPQAKLNELKTLRAQWESQRNSSSSSPRRMELHSVPKRLGKDGVQLHPTKDRRGEPDWLSRKLFQQIERWLDQGFGNCVLRDQRASEIVADALHFFDDQRYELSCYTIMPNHVHLTVRPFDGFELEDVCQSWKRHTSREINKLFPGPNRRMELHSVHDDLELHSVHDDSSVTSTTKTDGVQLHPTKRDSCPLWQDESCDRIIRDEEHLWRVIQYIGHNASRAGLSADSCPTWLKPTSQSLGWRFEAS